MKMKLVFALLLVFGAMQAFAGDHLSEADGEVVFYVSPSGDDADPGTIGEPFQTIAKAQQAVRAEIAGGMDADVIVYVRGGVYYLDTRLIFTDQDSGRDGYTVTYAAYPGEEPILDGGTLLTGWTAVDAHIYKTSVAPGWNFQTIAENGERGFMARHPNRGGDREGYLTVKAPYVTSSPFTQFHYGSGDIPAGLDPADGLEVYVWAGGPNGIWNWTSYVRDITSINESQKLITLASATAYELGVGSRYYVQGSKDLLDAPGEFYLDQDTNEVYYWPRSLPIASQTITVPQMIQMITFHGSSSANRVKDMVLNGLTIRNSDYDAEGYSNQYAMIRIDNADSITVSNNHIHDAGRSAIEIANYTQNIVVEGNWIHDFGYYGVSISGSSSADITLNNQIRNNLIHDGGVLIGHGSGIRLNHTRGNTVAYNRIYNMPRYGISMKNVRTQNNLIQYNELSNVNTDSQDTGVIEAWEMGPGNTIDHNRIHDSNIYFSYGFGIYLDDHTSGTTVQNNVIHDLQKSGAGTLRNPILVKGIENHITNNVMVNNEASRGPFGFSPQNEDLLFDHNVMVNSGDTVYTLPDWSLERMAAADLQLLYTDTGIYDVTGITNVSDFDDWRAFHDRQFDQGSLIAEPVFMDESAGDFRLRYDSPARKLGVGDIDYAKIGLQDTFQFDDQNDPISTIYPVDNNGDTISSLTLGLSQAVNVAVVVRTETGYIADLSQATVSYSSSKTNVATVNSAGTITAAGAGMSEITVTVTEGALQLSTKLHVFVEDELYQVHARTGIRALSIGETTPIYLATISKHGQFGHYSADDSAVTITNHHPSAVSVSSEGIITALTQDEARIEVAVTEDGVTKKDEIWINRPPQAPGSPWVETTYGSVTGYVDDLGDRLVMVTDGYDIWGSSDAFTYVYQDIDSADADDFAIITTVDSLNFVHKDTGAGVMIRDQDTASSYNAMARVLPGGGLRFTFRNSAYPDSWYQAGPNIALPATLKLSKQGNVLTAYYLDDEDEWQQYGQATVVMSGDVMAGVAAYSRGSDQTEAIFSQTSLEGIQQISAYEPINPILAADYDNLIVADWLVEYVEVDAWLKLENVNFGNLVPNRMNMSVSSGSGFPKAIEVRIDSLSGTLLGSGEVTPTGGWANFELQGVTLDSAQSLGITGIHDVYILMNTGGFSYGGNFEWFQFTALPENWSNQDIGAVGVEGQAGYDYGTFTVQGSGDDIWGSGEPDEFQFVYVPVTGNGEIVARVVSVENTHGNAKAGVMIRESLGAGSKYVIANTTPSNGQQTLWRNTSQGVTGYDIGASSTQPVWVKLTRSGSTFNAYESTNGTTWTLMYSVSVSMNSAVYAGLAVLSRDDAVLNTSVFDQVSVNF